MTEAILESVKLAALAATGHAEMNWDEWNWYYAQLTGQEGPAPEERGWQRTTGGAVLIGGRSTYPVQTWFNSAFGSVRGPGTAGGNGGAGNGGILATLAQPSQAIAGAIAGVLPANLKPQAGMIAAGALIVAGLMIRAGAVVQGALLGLGAAGLVQAMQARQGA